MKQFYVLITLLVLPALARAMDYSTLDNQQNELLARYEMTLKTAGSHDFIRQAIKNQDHKKPRP
jgi:hypothetical protein